MAQNWDEFWSVMKPTINIQAQLNTANFMKNWDVILLKKESIPRN
jgi:hypothetical protein